MNEEKQIEELARSFCGFSKTLKCSECSYECHQKEYARKAFEAGYRLASDVAREIIKDLTKFADDSEKQKLINGHSVWFIDADDITDFIAELKKKYTEGVNENTK